MKNSRRNMTGSLHTQKNNISIIIPSTYITQVTSIVLYLIRKDCTYVYRGENSEEKLSFEELNLILFLPYTSFTYDHFT